MDFRVIYQGMAKLDAHEPYLNHAKERLQRVLEKFPVKAVQVTVEHHARSDDYHIKMSCHLPKRTLFTGERGHRFDSVLDRCADKIIHKVDHFKKVLEHKSSFAEARHAKERTFKVDVSDLERLAEIGDFGGFRDQLIGFQGLLAADVRRKINGTGGLPPDIDEGQAVEDITEGVILDAFNRFANRPRDVDAYAWMVSLIDHEMDHWKQ
ncbi:MAG: hypothetical protein U1E76_02720 [Planctomycetota bacterium]